MCQSYIDMRISNGAVIKYYKESIKCFNVKRYFFLRLFFNGNRRIGFVVI